MSRKPVLISSALALVLAGLGVGLAIRPADYPSAQPVPLDPELGAWFPLEQGVVRNYEINSTNSFTEEWAVAVVGWEAIDGVPHARVDMHWALAKIYRGEWVRPGVAPGGEPQLLVTERGLDAARLRIVPPQPMLQGPLTPGATWSWEGRVGGAPCSASWRVLERDDETLKVEQRTETGSQASVHVRTYARGRGLIAEHGDLPTNDPSMVSELSQDAVLKE